MLLDLPTPYVSQKHLKGNRKWNNIIHERETSPIQLTIHT
jgi:hypothetical protein